MDKIESKNLLIEIYKQIPNPYLKNVWYDVTMPNGKPAQALSTIKGFLRIRKLVHQTLKSPEGEIIIDEGMQYIYFRCNIKTGDITRL